MITDKLSYSMTEAETLSSLSRHSLYKANKRGLLPFRKFGSKTLIMRADLEKFSDRTVSRWRLG